MTIDFLINAQKQIIMTQEHSRKELLGKKKLKFNITYKPTFQNDRNILQELHLLVAPDISYSKDMEDLLMVKALETT